MRTDKVVGWLANYWLLVIALVLTAILRFWHLGSIPPSLTPDEAALGYNAYSILKTGRDEYGKFLPIIFKSFGDYKPGLYVYLTVPLVASFGLTEFATRFPSALAGAISVGLIYLVVRELFGQKRLATLAAFVLAINPWSIYLSRGAWEVNVSLALTLAGIFFFLRFLKKPRYLVLSAVFFALTLLTYQGAKLSTGIIILLLASLYLKDLLKVNKRILGASFVAGFVIISPIIFSFFAGQVGRLNVFSLFSYPRPEETLTRFLNQGGETKTSLTYYLFHSEPLNFGRAILGRWFNHFSGRFLFFEGDWPNPRHTAPNQGVLLLSDIILLIAGLVALVRAGLKRETIFVWSWAILAPLPAVLSRDEVHAVRAFNLSIPLVLILAFGLDFIFREKISKVIKILFAGIYFASFTYFLDAYFVHLPRHNSQYWEYGYKQVVQTVSSIQSAYKTIKVQQSFAQPYIYFLFYEKYDPARFQKQAKLVESQYRGDVGYHLVLDNIQFAALDWPVNQKEHGALIVADPVVISTENANNSNLVKLIKEIKYLNGEVAFRIVEVK